MFPVPVDHERVEPRRLHRSADQREPRGKFARLTGAGTSGGRNRASRGRSVVTGMRGPPQTALPSLPALRRESRLPHLGQNRKRLLKIQAMLA
jgi:hypothetical protein